MKQDLDPKILICCECEQEFAFTVAAQEYFLQRGYSDDPKRCKSCHTQHKKSQRVSGRSTEEKLPFKENRLE